MTRFLRRGSQATKEDVPSAEDANTTHCSNDHSPNDQISSNDHSFSSTLIELFVAHQSPAPPARSPKQSPRTPPRCWSSDSSSDSSDTPVLSEPPPLLSQRSAEAPSLLSRRSQDPHESGDDVERAEVLLQAEAAGADLPLSTTPAASSRLSEATVHDDGDSDGDGDGDGDGDDATEMEPSSPILPPPPIARHPSPVYTTVLPPFTPISMRASASLLTLDTDAEGGTDSRTADMEPSMPILPPPPIARHPSPVYTTVLPRFTAAAVLTYDAQEHKRQPPEAALPGLRSPEEEGTGPQGVAPACEPVTWAADARIDVDKVRERVMDWLITHRDVDILRRLASGDSDSLRGLASSTAWSMFPCQAQADKA